MTICPNPDCRAENEDGVLYCDQCGADLSEVEPQVQETPASPAVPHPEEEDVREASEGEEEETDVFVEPEEDVATITPGDVSSAQEAEIIDESVKETAQPSVAKLTVLRGENPGEEFPIAFEGLHIIGRMDPDGRPVDIDLTDQEASLLQPSVSRQHAAITFESGKYMIEDLGSTNKVSINREPFLQVGQPQELKDGDVIILGRIHLKFELN